MNGMQTWSTADAPRGGRAAWWNALFAERFANVTFNPARSKEFEAELSLGMVGPLGIARIRSTPGEVERTSAHVGRGGVRLVSFIYIARGSGVFEHNGHVTRLDCGDFTLCDNAVPHRLSNADDMEMIVLRAKPEVMAAHLPQPAGWCGRGLSANALFAPAAAEMTRDLCVRVATGLPRRYAASAARNLLDVLATAFGAEFESGAAGTNSMMSRRLAARRHVDAHLRDPGLSPAQIADMLHVSPRYLRMLFQSEAESLSEYILRRRLEESARLLANPLWTGQKVAEIASSVGFISSAHFTRAFRKQFGTTPTSYRQQALRQPA